MIAGFSRELKATSPLLRELVSYGIIGTLCALSDTAVFWILTTTTGISPHVANATGVLFGMTLSFILNRSITFKVRDRVAVRLASFLAVGTFGLGLSAALLAIGQALALPLMRVKVASVLVVALVQFLLNRTITFRRRPEPGASS